LKDGKSNIFYLSSKPILKYFCEMQNSFKGRVVMITGGSSGIGKALASKLLQQNAKVAVCGRDESKLRSLKQELNSNDLMTFVCDVAQEADCKAFVEATIHQFQQIDVLINNAGISMRAMFESLDLSVLHQSMNINFWGTVYCTKFALPHIIKSQGNIVGISSIAGRKGLPCRTGYSASKFAMEGFLESLRIEMMNKNVHVMSVAPGFVASNIRNTALNENGQSQAETPLDESKLMSPEECAEIILNGIQRRKRSIVMTTQGKLTVWLNKFFPSFMDQKVFTHFANEPNSPLK
jgi:short-subunit dehydrogenase